MKQYGILLALLLLFSCEPDRGDKLDGKWLLEKVVKPDGTVNAVDTVWYNFQSTLFMYQLYEPTGKTYRYIHGFKTWESGDRILLELKPDPVSVESFLPYTDWKSGARSFSVNKNSGSALVLDSEGQTYHFRKF
ncbi:MAG: lipocalin-like domain-containing protein [Tannerellaceae bacterium]|nr:lipocalin-like domain-containing protein [Tannerellaceae bacterium]